MVGQAEGACSSSQYQYEPFADVSNFQYLVGTEHYDQEYKKVYRVTKVIEEEFETGVFIVGYRDVCLISGGWKPEKYAINIGDIESYHHDEFCQAQKEIVKANMEDKRNRKKK